MEEYIQVSTTIDNYEIAKKMAHVIIDKHFAACVQILGPVESIFWWKGEKDTAREWILFIKTTMNLYKKLESVLKDMHPYEVPEIIVLPVIDGNNDYLRWIADEVRNA